MVTYDEILKVSKVKSDLVSEMNTPKYLPIPTKPVKWFGS